MTAITIPPHGGKEPEDMNDRRAAATTLAEKMRTVTAYGFAITFRAAFDAISPQAAREGIKGASGAFAVYDPGSDSEGWALVGDDLDEILSLTIDTLL